MNRERMSDKQDEDVKGVPGFRFAAARCGIKEADRLDLALIASERVASVAGAFTTNSMAAAPVILGRELVQRGRARALLVNSGCANACTGERGLRDAIQCARWVSEALGVPEDEVLLASTGVIGTYLPMERLRKGIEELARALNPSGLDHVARAIMTTDKIPKWTLKRGQIDGAHFHMGGVVKGAGMIHPRLATMLCFVFVDLNVSPDLLNDTLKEAVEDSFHAITVDGDTSTNDTVLMMASGASSAPSPDEHEGARAVFEEMTKEVMRELAVSVVRDAEGATKLVRICVEGAPDEEAAGRIARCVAHSPLVKTAFYGEEVNWGRIAASVGYSGIRVEPAEFEVWYDGVQVVKEGVTTGTAQEERAKEIARRREFTVRIIVGGGPGSSTLYTCDLSHDYVTINASYKT
jgi:glutamate N-acetyltransferase/amino-acid N-acetyltransferase